MTIIRVSQEHLDRTRKRLEEIDPTAQDLSDESLAALILAAHDIVDDRTPHDGGELQPSTRSTPFDGRMRTK